LATNTTDTANRCPSCGRYVGPGGHQACPYCGARLTGRVSVRAVQITAILLATVGLIILWLAAVRAPVPMVQIGQAGATMNMAYVRLEGHCTRSPTYDPASDYLSFWIEDDTGEIRVSAYRAETRQIIAQGRVPAPGDLVEVAGTLRVREDFLSLTVNVPEQLAITRAEPVEREIGAIGPEDQYLRVQIQGQVREVYRPYQGLTLITIRDGSGAIPVAVSEDLLALDSGGVASPTLPITIGQSVRIVAAVSLYGDTPQLVPASLADLQPLAQPVIVAVERRIGELTDEDAARPVAVRGTIAKVDPFSAGVKLTLDDGSGSLVVLLWQSIYDGLDPAAQLDVGADIQVQGQLSRYRGELELIPEMAGDVQVLIAAAPPSETTVGALQAGDVGRVVTVRGTIGPPEPFSAGVKFPLDDGTGQITLLLWSNVHEGLAAEPGAGDRMVVTGQVSEYRGELELIPRDASQVQVTGRAASQPSPPTPTVTPSPSPQAIGNVTAADVGTVLTLVGVLGEREAFSAGVKFPLRDESGEIVLLLWKEVYAALPDADRWTAGARVEVTGRIEEYRGELEIIPDAAGVRVVE